MQTEALAPDELARADGADHSGIAFSVEEITPDVAGRILEGRLRPGAAEDPKAVATYAEIMRAGGWIMNGQPIVFDTEGHLVDGVQRLAAVVRSGVTITSLVARNVRADTLHTIDQHRRRSYTGVLESRGIRSAGPVMRTMSKLIRIENGALGREPMNISWSRYDRVLEANPEIHKAVEIAETNQGSALHSTARPVLAFMAIRAGKERKVREFLRATVDDSTYELNSPARMLSLQMKMAREQGHPFDVDTALALGILAFNDFSAGRTVNRHYVWKPDYGGALLDDKGNPSNKKSLREKAPPNLGLPVVSDYPGLEEGHFDVAAETDEFGGRIAHDIIEGRRTDTGEEKVRILMVTPELARKWLSRFNRGNRKIQMNHVAMIKRDIQNENWMVNAQPICFHGDPLKAEDDDEARLLNGQHRLMACIQSELPIEVPIATNIPEEAFATYDIHAKRAIRRPGPRIDDRVLAAAARLQWKTDNGIPFTTRMSPSATEIKDTIDRHPGLVDCFPRARKMESLASAGVMTWLIYHVRQEDDALGDEFLNGLETGDLLEKGNPILSLRTAMIGQRGEKSRVDVLGVLLSGWESFKAWKEKKAAKEENREPSLL
jgi:hypothetical protein